MKMRKLDVHTAVLLAAFITAGHLALLPAGSRADAVPLQAAQDKPDKDTPDADLTKAFKDAEVVFTGKLSKVQPRARTNSIPPSILGNVTFKEVKTLRGVAPADSTFSYSYREGVTKNLDLKLDVPVVVAVKGKGAYVIVPATETNLALAMKALAPVEKN